MPALGRSPDPAAYAPTGTTPRSSAVAEHLHHPDGEFRPDSEFGSDLGFRPDGDPRPGHDGPDPGGPRHGGPGHGDRLELVPGGLGSSDTGHATPGPPSPATRPPTAPLDALVTRSRLPARPGTQIRTVLRQVDTRTLDRPGGPPAGEPAGPAPATAGDTAARPPRHPPQAPTPLGRTYPTAVARASVLNRAAARERPRTSSLQVQAMLVTTALRYGVDPALALAVAYQESGFDQRRVSPANAIGVMQIIPSAGAWASTVVGRRLDLLDVEDNVMAGVALLSCLLAAAPEPFAVAGYYQGLASVQRSGLLPDTRRYVATVQTLKSRFS